MESRAAFCARLRAAREKQGVSLEQISASTKINIALLRGLEASDLSRWPRGLFRRSYVRDYLRAINLLSEDTVAEFLRLFPDDGHPVVEEIPEPEPADFTSAFPLSLGDDRRERSARAFRLLLAAVIDGSVVLALTAAVASVFPADFWACGMFVALGYYSIATASIGRSFGSWWVVDRSWRRWRKSAAPAAASDSFVERMRRLQLPSMRRGGSTVGDVARVPWNASLLRIWFLR
jgi:transcriptional regulator with XRE-family HTH domain